VNESGKASFLSSAILEERKLSPREIIALYRTSIRGKAYSIGRPRITISK
jgi:hypothetical protein